MIKKIVSGIATVAMVLLMGVGEPPAQTEPKTQEPTHAQLEREVKTNRGWTDMGVMEVTAYAAYETGGNKTATGTVPKAYRTVAVDPRIIPLGAKLYIEGLDIEVTAEDTGGAVKGNIVDLFIGEDSCKQFGRQKHRVWRMER